MGKKIIFGSLGLITLILIAIAGWTFYSLANKGLSDLLGMAGVSNFYLQGGLIILGIVIALLIIGGGSFVAIKKIIKG
tara:strand:- start:775 stop:1008 length:234 start_codon:yes stop_codon:yes gene_type:complete